MFYEPIFDKALRFGDVVKGFIFPIPVINDPSPTNEFENFNIGINFSKFFAVLSPCCSIADKTISLAPLIELWPGFFSNPYLVKDLTRINRLMRANQAMLPSAWEGLPLDKKQEKLEEGLGFAFVSLFIYEQNELFPLYKFKMKSPAPPIETRFYMVDFRDTFKVDCDKVNRGETIKSKCLQLSLKVRAELRNKMADYFGRVPLEDKVAQD